MVGLVRVYVEPKLGIPENMRPERYCPFYDVEEDDVVITRKFWKDQGFDVICVPI